MAEGRSELGATARPKATQTVVAFLAVAERHRCIVHLERKHRSVAVGCKPSLPVLCDCICFIKRERPNWLSSCCALFFYGVCCLWSLSPGSDRVRLILFIHFHDVVHDPNLKEYVLRVILLATKTTLRVDKINSANARVLSAKEYTYVAL
jgi:hypothetical protein